MPSGRSSSFTTTSTCLFGRRRKRWTSRSERRSPGSTTPSRRCEPPWKPTRARRLPRIRCGRHEPASSRPRRSPSAVSPRRRLDPGAGSCARECSLDHRIHPTAARPRALEVPCHVDSHPPGGRRCCRPHLDRRSDRSLAARPDRPGRRGPGPFAPDELPGRGATPERDDRDDRRDRDARLLRRLGTGARGDVRDMGHDDRLHRPSCRGRCGWRVLFQRPGWPERPAHRSRRDHHDRRRAVDRGAHRHSGRARLRRR